MNKESKLKYVDKIIEVLNGDNSIYKMMRIYIFKIIYNKFRIDAFTDEKMIEK